ncbi:hypothetical protein CDEF62S_01794 [Castellaniella defragrans]
MAMAVDSSGQHPPAGGIDVSRAGRQLRGDGRDTAIAYSNIAFNDRVVGHDAPAANSQVEALFHECVSRKSLRQGFARPDAVHDETIKFGPAMLGEIEYVLAKILANPQIGLDHDHLVVFGQRACRQFTRRRNDD